jgi:hypothetical protein
MSSGKAKEGLGGPVSAERMRPVLGWMCNKYILLI